MALSPIRSRWTSRRRCRDGAARTRRDHKHDDRPEADQEPAAKKAKAKPAARVKKPDQPRTLKKDRLVEMLRKPEGATIEEITEAFGILPHRARATISVTARRLGVEATRDDRKVLPTAASLIGWQHSCHAGGALVRGIYVRSISACRHWNGYALSCPQSYWNGA
jgi:hypothetical protein